jgi:hypothetical protein
MCIVLQNLKCRGKEIWSRRIKTRVNTSNTFHLHNTSVIGPRTPQFGLCSFFFFFLLFRSSNIHFVCFASLILEESLLILNLLPFYYYFCPNKIQHIQEKFMEAKGEKMRIPKYNILNILRVDN